MRAVPAAAAVHFLQDSTRLALCWSVAKADGTYIRGTDHDQDIGIDHGPHAGTYPAGVNITVSDMQSNADTAIDNMEVTGATVPSATLGDISVFDIESGNLAGAEVVLFACDWQSPNDWQVMLQYGHLGEIVRDSDNRYTTELRSLKQLFTQIFVGTYSTRCTVRRFGDAQCKFAIATVTYPGAVTTPLNRKSFHLAITGSPDETRLGYGELHFLTGPNAGITREVKSVVGGLATFWEPFPAEPQTGDTFSIVQGCDRLFASCQHYANQVNFRGYGLFVEGIAAMLKGPT